MATRTVGLLVVVALALGAAAVVAFSSSTSSATSAPAASSTTAPAAPAPAKSVPGALSSKQSEPPALTRPGPPVPRRDLVQKITPVTPPAGVPAPAVPATAGSAAARPVPAEATAAAADAHRHFRDGDFASARTAADAYLATAGRDHAMVRIAAVSACALGDAQGAATYLRRADRNLRAAIELACAQHGVKLPPAEKRERRPRAGAKSASDPGGH